MDIDVEVDVDVDRYFGCLKGGSKSVYVLFLVWISCGTDFATVETASPVAAAPVRSNRVGVQDTEVSICADDT